MSDQSKFLEEISVLNVNFIGKRQSAYESLGDCRTLAVPY